MQERIANLKDIISNNPQYYEGVATQQLLDEMNNQVRRV